MFINSHKLYGKVAAMEYVKSLGLQENNWKQTVFYKITQLLTTDWAWTSHRNSV